MRKSMLSASDIIRKAARRAARRYSPQTVEARKITKRDDAIMNLAFSYRAQDDKAFHARGDRFLGAGYDQLGHECHVFVKKGKELKSG